MIRTTRIKLDLILTNDKDEAIILDVAMPFENGPDAFSRAQDDKVKKYAPIIQILKKKLKFVRVEAIVVGLLGSWDRKKKSQNLTKILL